MVVYGSCVIQGRPFDGQVCYLIPSSAFAAEPQAGDTVHGTGTPVPVSGAIASITSGEQNGQAGGYRFDNLASQDYYVAYSFANISSYDYHPSVLSGVSSTGFVLFHDPTVNEGLTASGNLVEIITPGGGNDQYQLVNRYGIAATSGFLSGVLNILVPQNCEAINIQSNPLSGGRTAIRINEQFSLFANSNGPGFARGWCGIHDHNKPNPSGGIGGRDVFWIDDDTQAHIEPSDNNVNSGNNCLKLAHRLNAGLTAAPGIAVAIEMHVDNDGGYAPTMGEIQTQLSTVTAGAEKCHMGFFTRFNGTLYESLRLAEGGEIQVNPLSVGTSGWISVKNDPYPTSDYGLLTLGAGPWDGSSTGHFVGGNHTVIALNLAAGYAGQFINGQIGGVERFHCDSLGHWSLRIHDNTTNAVSYPLALKHFVDTGTPAVGEGTGIQFNGLDSAGTDTPIGTLEFEYTGVTPGNCKGRLAIYTASGNTTTAAAYFKHNLNLEGNGALYLVKAPVATASWAQVNIGDGDFGESDTARAGSFNGNTGGTYVAVNAGSSFGGDLLNLQVSGGVRFHVTAAGVATHSRYSTSGTVAATALQLEHKLIQGSPAAGIGSSIQFLAPNSLLTAIEAAQIDGYLTAVTAGSEKGRLDFKTLSGGIITTTLALKADLTANFAGQVLATGGLGVGNTVSKTTLTSPGTVVRMMEVFDASGTSIGAVPVYNTGSFS